MMKRLCIFILSVVFTTILSYGQTTPPRLNSGKSLSAIIGKNIRYPTKLADSCRSSFFSVSFTIDTQGQVANVRMSDGADTAFTREAKRVLMLTSGQWVPETNGGKKVSRNNLILPFLFRSESYRCTDARKKGNPMDEAANLFRFEGKKVDTDKVYVFDTITITGFGSAH